MKGQQKLVSATATLKRKLETVYDVPLDSPESNFNSSEKSDLLLFRKMWAEQEFRILPRACANIDFV